jgi:peptidoglycan/LPS O-acetylase OafA/YrhL
VTSAAGGGDARDPALDGLRGLAAGMVVTLHGFRPPGPGVTVLQAVADSLFVGVDLFFVLSGFLITSVLIRTRGTVGYYRNFYARRALRILPAYYVVLAGVYLLHSVARVPAWSPRMFDDAPYFVSYTQNFLMAVRRAPMSWPGLDHTWSLAIEEQFYLLWPPLLWLVQPRHLTRFCLLIWGGSLAIRFGLCARGVAEWTINVLPLSHVDGLALGGALAAWSSQPHRSRRILPFRLIGASAGLYLLWDTAHRARGCVSGAWEHVIFYGVAPVMFAWILLEVVAGRPEARVRWILANKPLMVLGRYSYGVYLVHYWVLAEVRALFLTKWQARLGINLGALACGVAMVVTTTPLVLVMYSAVEQPLLRLKRHFAPPRSDPQQRLVS